MCNTQRKPESIIPAVILAIAAFMAILGSMAMGSTLVLRLGGMGNPALAHMAAALALAISSNWFLSEDKKRERDDINTSQLNEVELHPVDV